MKLFYLLAFILSAQLAQAQSVAALQPGKYSTKAKAWDKGDVVLLDNGRYKLSSSGDVGEYRFSVAAQRIFFISGPLKSAFTKVVLNNGKTIIIFPVEQNPSLGIAAEVWASQ